MSYRCVAADWIDLAIGRLEDTVSADVTADAYIEDIKYCPFCGEEL